MQKEILLLSKDYLCDEASSKDIQDQKCFLILFTPSNTAPLA